ncbi:uncharacterized protein sh2d7 [Menidia menidia]
MAGNAGAEGGLKELVLRWFAQTQAAAIMQDGSFPDWFQGLASRREAEDLLADKTLGSFLIRLSDKAIGYILSYRGHDRCRHFVISQKPDGQFVVAGDCELFGSLAQLIEHYKASPILPFGECLTSSGLQEDAAELYDVVKAKASPGVSVQALRSLWSHGPDGQREASGSSSRPEPPGEPPPPMLPLKARNRKLTGTVSVDAASLSQALPPVPKRGIPLGFSLRGSFPETSHPGHSPPGPDSPPYADLCTPPVDICPPQPEQEEGRCRSLPHLEGSVLGELEGPYSDLAGPPSAVPAPRKRVTCQTYSLHGPSNGPPSPGPGQGGDQDLLRPNPLYQASDPAGGGPGPAGGGRRPARGNLRAHSRPGQHLRVPGGLKDQEVQEHLEQEQFELEEVSS